MVDDYDDARATVREMLEELRAYEVVEAENGQEAFDYVISHPDVRVQLTVLDLRMPVMNGWEFLALMRSYVRLSRIPIVVAKFCPRGLLLDPKTKFLSLTTTGISR